MPQPHPHSPQRRSAAIPVLALIVLMLVVVLAVNLLQPSNRTNLTASLEATQPLGVASSSAAGSADTASAPPTAIPTTAPVTVPDLAAPVERGDGTGQADVSAGSALVIPTSTPVVASPTAVPVTPTSIATDATEVDPEPTSAPPTPTTSAVPEPTATPLPQPTATAVPEPTPPLPVGVPPIQATPTAAPAPTTAVLMSSAEMELYVFNAINGVRARAGLPAVQLREDLSVIARDWSTQMAAAGFISHRPQAELSAMLPAGWSGWAENVAEAPTVQWAQSALEQSSGHYRNMVGQYTVVGVGVVVAPSGQVFVTHNFAKY